MIFAPAFDEPAVLEMIRCEYGLPAKRMAFLTTGWVSFCYRIDAVDGKSLLLPRHGELMGYLDRLKALQAV